jgi:23S rRNA pseudouridine2605 synthase
MKYRPTLGYRRDADIHIAPVIFVNGKPITEMLAVQLMRQFDGRLLNPWKKEYVVLNKLKDFSTTIRWSKDMFLVWYPTNFKISLLPVDKLDKEDTGLLRFTNDGDLTKTLKVLQRTPKIYHLVLIDLISADLSENKKKV